LGDRWRRLRRAAIAFDAERPCMGLGAVGVAGGLNSCFRACSAFILAAVMRPPQITSRDLVLFTGLDQNLDL
jgi:hypothetical protein